MATAVMSQDEFTRRFREARRDLRNVALRWARHPENAEDLLSESLERAWRYRHLFDGRNFVGWVATIITNRAHVRHRRKHFIDCVEEVPEVGHPPEHEYLMPAYDAARIFAALPAQQREAWWVTQVDGLSYPEAAAALNVHGVTLRTRIRRARIAMQAAV